MANFYGGEPYERGRTKKRLYFIVGESGRVHVVIGKEKEHSGLKGLERQTTDAVDQDLRQMYLKQWGGRN